MDLNSKIEDPGTAEALADGHRNLTRRLDDLRGLGLLPAWSDTMDVAGEESLQRLALSLIDLLESAQRRVIETSIQLLSLRELVAGVLNMRTPEEVAKTVSLYLHKAFDHERVLVGVYDAEADTLEGWVAVRRGSPRCSSYRLSGSWGGALRDALSRVGPIRSWQDDSLLPLVEGSDLPACLDPFLQESIGPYIVYPLIGSAQERSGALGILAVARGFGSPTMDGMDAEILESLVESVATALENVILDEDIRRQEAFRTDIMGSMTSGLLAVDLEGRVLTMNERAEAMTGYPMEDLRGTEPKRLDPTGTGILALLGRTLAEGRVDRRRDTALQTRDGRSFPIAATTAQLRNPAGEVYGAVMTFEDLSEIKAMEERIRQLDRLAALGRFTSGVAHEIRNPLAGIAAGIQYLARHLDGLPDQEENFGFIEREIERLNRIVEDLFQVTHPLPPRRTPEDARALVDLAVRCLGTSPQERGVRLEITGDSDLPRVPADPDQIQQVLINLIKNALEATPAGGRIGIEFSTADSGTAPHLVIRIRDTGRGIDPDHLPHVFEPFYSRGKAGGTGLGLYVSHGIVERHGGELLAANAEGGGAVFTLRLPLTSYDTTETTG